MKKIFIWGAGKDLDTVYKAINKELCIVAGIVDKDSAKQGKKVIDNIKIESPVVLNKAEFDYVVVSPKRYESILDECRIIGIDSEKVLVFWKEGDKIPFIDYKEKRIAELEEEVEKYKARLENLPYELGQGTGICIKSSEELLKVIIEKKVSLCRFGDGELELMRMKERLWYQKVNEKLAFRLREILASDEPNILVAVSDNFGNLEHYTERAADVIRQYLYNGTRAEIMELLNTDSIYYDAYVSRPYYIYKNKRHSEIVFSLWKQVWNNRNVLIVEGKYGRTGINNDLLNNVKAIRRIICPETNSFDYYEKIFNDVKSLVMQDELVLVSLGPTATVLAYDLAKEGIQTLDIGQIDNEYEWFVRGAEDRIKIPEKRVAELSWCRELSDEEEPELYKQQIIDRIGL